MMFLWLWLYCEWRCFIPRPETEELVGLVLSKFDDYFADKDHVNVFDVATGSGAIGITLNLEEPRMDVIASDISKRSFSGCTKE